MLVDVISWILVILIAPSIRSGIKSMSLGRTKVVSVCPKFRVEVVGLGRRPVLSAAVKEQSDTPNA